MKASWGKKRRKKERHRRNREAAEKLEWSEIREMLWNPKPSVHLLKHEVDYFIRILPSLKDYAKDIPEEALPGIIKEFQDNIETFCGIKEKAKTLIRNAYFGVSEEDLEPRIKERLKKCK